MTKFEKRAIRRQIEMYVTEYQQLPKDDTRSSLLHLRISNLMKYVNLTNEQRSQHDDN